MDIYNLYTDGACSGNPGPGGWAFAVFINDEQTPHFSQSGHNPNTTNNRMELEAFINAVAFVALNDIKNKYYICTDSAYIYNCFKNKWYEQWEENGWKNSKKQPVLNKNFWEIILQLYRTIIKKGYDFEIVKVEGHSIDKRNNFVDRLAVKESKRRQ